MVWQHRGESRADTEMALWPHRPTEPSDQASVYSLPVELISADLRSGVECSIIVNFNGAVMSVLRLHMTEIVKANPAQRAVWVWGMCKPCYLVSICRGGGSLLLLHSEEQTCDVYLTRSVARGLNMLETWYLPCTGVVRFNFCRSDNVFKWMGNQKKNTLLIPTWATDMGASCTIEAFRSSLHHTNRLEWKLDSGVVGRWDTSYSKRVLSIYSRWLALSSSTDVSDVSLSWFEKDSLQYQHTSDVKCNLDI